MQVKYLLNRALRQLIQQVQGQLRSFALTHQELSIEEICIYSNPYVKCMRFTCGRHLICYIRLRKLKKIM